MTEYTISITLTDKQISVTTMADVVLLDVMLQHDIRVRRACRNGSCGVCKCRLTDGKIDYFHRTAFALIDSQKEQGYILPCIAGPISDISIDEVSLLPIKRRSDINSI